jgi:MFS transporter, putative metabolite:H+ symporter
MDLICENDLKIGMIGGAFFAGWTLMTLIVPPLADKHGRKGIQLVSYAVLLVCLFGLQMTHKINWTIFLCFLSGMTVPATCQINYVHTMEFLTPNQQVVYSAIVMSMDCTVYLLATIYFWMISTNQVWFSLVFLFLTFVSLVSVNYFVPESPLWLLKSGRIKQAEHELSQIFKFNGTPMEASEIHNALSCDKERSKDDEEQELLQSD